MPQFQYSKPSLTYNQQLQQLKNRGLIITNDNQAIHLLETISYYRLSGYWYPLLSDKVNHVFKLDSRLDAAFQLYCFDRKLRQLVSAELEKIEVAIRAKLIYILSHRYGSFWYQLPNLFKQTYKHNSSLNKLTDEFNRSDEEFIKAFKIKYADPLPPAWMLLEITSFGTLSILYSNLKSPHEKRDVAHYFGLPDSVMQTWLHSFVYVRNICAHHSRLWNKTLSISPQAPQKPLKPWLANPNVSNRRVFFILSMIRYLLQTVHPKSDFPQRLSTLIQQYPNADPNAMGFSHNWRHDPFWK